MHYTEYFSMRHYAGFSQIGSHIVCMDNIHIDVKKQKWWLRIRIVWELYMEGLWRGWRFAIIRHEDIFG